MSDQANDSSTATNNAAVETQTATPGADGAAGAPGATESKGTEATQLEAGKTEDSTKDNPSEKPGESAAEVEYVFEMPEGIELDEARAADFKGIAKELNLSQEAAQKLVNLGIAREQEILDRHTNMVKGWAEAVEADTELSTSENKATARKVIDTFGTPELKQYLNTTGLGNHPELVRLALKVGKAMSEDAFVAGKSSGAPEPKSAEDILYGKS